MNLSYQIHQILKSIVEKTYPDKNIKSFFVEVHSKEMRTRHGDYSPRERKIRIFNLSQPTEYTVSTAIHELAHHCEFSIYGNTGHSKQFYFVFKELLETSVKMGIIDYAKARTQSNANDITMLEKHFGPITAAYNPEYDEKKDIYIIRVTNCYSIKDLLSNRGYRYNPQEQCWSREVNKTDSQNEETFLKNYLPDSSIDIREAKEIVIEAIYYVIVKNAFSCKAELKDNGYFFNGYNRKGKVWVKKIKASELNREKQFLNNFKDIQITVEGVQNK